MRIGLISDTHGLLRPEALAALGDVERIIHAGDIGSPEILDQLGRIAPVSAVRGNNDRASWADSIPDTEAVAIGEVILYVLHDIHDLDLDPAAAGFQAVIAGHSHRPLIETRDGVLFVNPGSAGPRRFRLPVTLGFLEIANGRIDARIHSLE